MIIRRSILLLAVLAASACSQIFPAKKSEPAVTSLQPRVQKTGARRREGSTLAAIATTPFTQADAFIATDGR